MEFIKKTILQALTTGTTATTEGTKYIITPDLTACYNMKVGLKTKVNDIGFFDAYITGSTNIFPKSVTIECQDGGHHTEISQLSCGCLTTSPSISTGESYLIELGWRAYQNDYILPISRHCMDVYCNGNSIYTNTILSRDPIDCSGIFGTIQVNDSDIINMEVYTSKTACVYNASNTSIYISSVTNNVGCFRIGQPPGERICLIAEPGSA